MVARVEGRQLSNLSASAASLTSGALVESRTCGSGSTHKGDLTCFETRRQEVVGEVEGRGKSIAT